MLQISTDVNKFERTELKPMVKFVGNMHGNEVVGRELLIMFAEFLLETYSNNSDPEVTWLVENTDIHILPSMNPDGFEESVLGLCRGSIGNLSANLMQVVPLYHTY